MRKLKAFIIFILLDLCCYFLMAIGEASFNIIKWSEPNRLNLDAYITFSLVLTIFYYIDRI